MTDDLRDVLRRARANIVELLEAHRGIKGLQNPITDDIDRLLAADEDAKYRDEAEDLLNYIRLNRVMDNDADMAASWLKARDQRRKEAEHGK